MDNSNALPCEAVLHHLTLLIVSTQPQQAGGLGVANTRTEEEARNIQKNQTKRKHN